MSDTVPAPRSRFFLRRLLALSVLVAAVSPAFVATAAAQTPFRADVRSVARRPVGGCLNGAYACGTAVLTGYGAATWNLFITGGTAVDSPCGSTYTATTEFTLAADPRSILVLDESGDLCGLGHDGAAYRAYFVQGSNAYGHPFAIVGNWTADSASTGQFSGVTGAGTDLINVAGANIAGTYQGTLG